MPGPHLHAGRRLPTVIAALAFAFALAGILVPSAAAADTTAPKIWISSPASGAGVTGTFTVAGTASDNVGISKVEAKIDSGSYSVTASGKTSWTVSINASAYSTGSHVVTV